MREMPVCRHTRLLIFSTLAILVASTVVVGGEAQESVSPPKEPPQLGWSWNSWNFTEADSIFRRCCEAKNISASMIPRCNYTRLEMGNIHNEALKLPGENEYGYDSFMQCLGAGEDVRDCCPK